MEQKLEPKLIRLMNDDEQQFVVRRGKGQGSL
jgi:hypothetical protein